MVIGFTAMAVGGEAWTGANAYQPHGVMMIEGTIGAPPYAPSSVFPWGTDQLGRDIQALVLSGARQTLLLAFFATVARLLLGSVLGMLAGWAQGGWLDQFVTGAMGVWAAFPVTLFAMILIQAIGIKQGVWVFVVALSVVGWGEVAQLMRNKVIELKPRLFVEAARSHRLALDPYPQAPPAPQPGVAAAGDGSTGDGRGPHAPGRAGLPQHLSWGRLPSHDRRVGRHDPRHRAFLRYSRNGAPCWPTSVSGGELIRGWPGIRGWPSSWPSWPFNLLGEGIRRMVDRGQFDLSRLVNRYTLLASTGLVILLVVGLRRSPPHGGLSGRGQLSSTRNAPWPTSKRWPRQSSWAARPGLWAPGGPRTTSPQQMQAIGLSPAGDGNSFIQTFPSTPLPCGRRPKLDVIGPGRQPAGARLSITSSSSTCLGM